MMGWRVGLCALLVGCAPARGSSPRTQVIVNAETQPEDALSERLAGYASVLRTQGFVETSFRASGFLPPGERDTQAVSLPAMHCGLFVALASPTVEDLDAAIYTADGKVLVEDDRSDAQPVLSLCAGEAPLELYYSVHAYQGAGAFVARVFQRPVQASDQVVVLGRDGPSPMVEQIAQLRKRGFQDQAQPVDLALESDAPVRMALKVDAGQCYTLVAEGRDGLETVSLRLLDPGGRELAQGVGDGGLAALQYCASESGDYGVELTADRGQGTARVARFHAPQSVIGGARALWLGEPSPSDPALSQRVKTREEWQAALAQEHARIVLFEKLPLAQGQVHERALDRPAARCEQWHVLPHEGLSRARLKVEGVDGTTLAEVEISSEGASTTLCDRRQPARLVLLGHAGFGSVTLVGAASAQGAE